LNARKGWDEGVMEMSLGEKAILHITADYGYGAQGAGGVIPPNADLDFEVELLQIGDQVAEIPSEKSPCGCILQ
jgi:FK506-binding protein 1